MRLGFVTCVQLGAEVLDEIHELGGSVDAVVTLKDDIAPNKSGRVYVDDLAELHEADLHKTSDINDNATVGWLLSKDLDWLFIIGWSQIAHEAVLESARLGTLGMHPTLLPEGRGRASIPWAIIKGLTRTGVTLFKLNRGVDTGPILDAVEVSIHPDETASTLYFKVMEAHRRLIRENLPVLERGTAFFQPQDDSEATSWPGRTPEDGRMDETMTTAEASALVRALAPPYPGARWSDSRGRDWQIIAGTPDGLTHGLRIPLRDGTYVATIFQSL